MRFLFTGMAILAGMAGAEEADVKRYSYLCLEAAQDMCIGISPGEAEPRYDPAAEPYYAQVKSRKRNEFQATDYKKTRWDLVFETGAITLSRFAGLCLGGIGGGAGKAGLVPCGGPGGQTEWNLRPFLVDGNGAGVLSLVGEGEGPKCLTVMRCVPRGKPGQPKYCDPDAANTPIGPGLEGLSAGSYLRFRECGAGDSGVPSQRWRQKLDCAVACPPFLQENGECDASCDVAECGWDSGSCDTPSPTPPTPEPSRTPTFPRPTSRSPSSKSPTARPSQKPTQEPSTHPSQTPQSPSPTLVPTRSPGVACPLGEEIERCAANSQRTCTKSPAVAANCTYCFGACQPRTDARVCSIPRLYDACPAACATPLQRARCPAALTREGCTSARKYPWRAANCQWCSAPAQKCAPGKNPRACVDPAVFAHCGTPAPTMARCPTPREFSVCLAQTAQPKCGIASAQKTSAGCVWCGAAQNQKCRPGRSVQICTVPIPKIKSEVFAHCPLLLLG